MITIDTNGAAVTDFMFMDDLIIDPITGDFKVDFSDNQHVSHIFILDLGQARQAPLIGIGILKQRKGSIPVTNLKSTIRKNLTADNYNLLTLNIDKDYNITTQQTRVK